MPIEADMMLAGAVNASSGTLNVLGAGWQVRAAAPTTPLVIAVVLRIPRRQAGQHTVRLELLNWEGEPVTTPEVIEGAENPVASEATIVARGTEDRELRSPLVVPFALTLPPFPLEPGREYQWQLHVDGKTRPSWTLPFRTMFPDEEESLKTTAT